MDTILKAKNLKKTYPGFTLDGISFELPAGAIMGLIGENGSGKTTTIKMLLNIIANDGGEVEIFGKDLLTNEKLIKNRVGLIFDDINFYEQLNAKDIDKIMKGFFPELWNRSQFYSLLNRFNLPDNKMIKEFSRGMKTKLSLSVALSHDPYLLILDEPTSGLDPVARTEILDIFMEFIQDERKSILVSSHITTDLEKVADYVTYIHNGKLVFSESKDELLSDYAILKCGNDELSEIDSEDILGINKNSFGCEILVKDREKMASKYSGAIIDNVSLEEIMVFKNKGEDK